MTPPAGRRRSSRRQRALAQRRAPARISLEQLWTDRRSGARNVTGVSYQLRLTLHLLVQMACGDFPSVELRPEGFEDIDTIAPPGHARYFVQAKEIADDTRRLGMGDLADFLVHVMPVLRDDPVAIGVLVTNGSFSPRLTVTDWTSPLDLDANRRRELAQALEGVSDVQLDEFIPRLRLVREPGRLDEMVEDLSTQRGLDPAVAEIALANCLAKVIGTIERQARAPHAEPQHLRTADLEASIAEATRAIATGQVSPSDLRRVLTPLTFRDRSPMTQEQFLDGVDVKPEHIAAGLDVERPKALSQIRIGLADSQLAVVVGPSGAGKSALLWRAAVQHAATQRVWEVNSLEHEDVDILVAAVEQQRPSPTWPILICVDDIGRASRSGWRRAAALLLRIQGVHLLGAAREEDFAIEDAMRRAVIVRPNLDRRLAMAIHGVLRSRGVQPAVSVDEALPQARGLVMEFLHLILAGRRLSTVLSEQASQLERAERYTELQVARYVTTANSVGLDTASSIVAARFAGPELAAGLARLEREHLLIQQANGAWTGLHELRSAELSKLLHRRPPPRLADTLGQIIHDAPAAYTSSRLPAIARTAQDSGFIATHVADRVIDAGATDSAQWLEAARMADIAQHVVACLEVAREWSFPRPVRLAQVMLAVHSARFAAVDLSAISTEIGVLAAQLPEQQSHMHRAITTSISADVWLQRLASASAAVRARLLEALEEGFPWRADETQRLAHLAVTDAAPLTARCIASIHRNCADQPTREAFLQALPSPATRLDMLQDIYPLVSVAAYDHESRVARVRLLHPVDGNESAERVATELVGWVLDLLPEAERCEATVTRYDGADMPINGQLGPHKSIPRSNYPPHAVTRWNRVFHDFTERELESTSFTRRLRMQSTAVALALELVPEVADRVGSFGAEEPRLARRWADRVGGLQQAVSGLKALPNSSAVELSDRSAPPRSERDHAVVALGTVASALGQLADAISSDLDEPLTVHSRRVGWRLRDAAAQYRDAVNEGSPRFVDEPEPLDDRLAAALINSSTCLIGFADGAQLTRREGSAYDATLLAAVKVRSDQLQAEYELLSCTLGPDFAAAVEQDTYLVCAGDHPQVVADARRWLILVLPSQLESASAKLLAMTSAPTISHPLAFRVILAPGRDGSAYNATGFTVGRESVFPMDAGELRTLCAEVGVSLYPGRYVREVEQAIEALIRASRAGCAANQVPSDIRKAELRSTAELELDRARGIVNAIGLGSVTEPLRRVADLVTVELAGRGSSVPLAIQFDDLQSARTVGQSLIHLQRATDAAAYE